MTVDLNRIEADLARKFIFPGDVRELINEVRRLNGIIARFTTSTVSEPKRKPRKQGMTPAERKALCDALNAYKMPGPFLPGREKCRGADLSVHTFGGSHLVHRTPEGNATYLVVRTGVEGEYLLGTFVGRGWPQRLADAVVAKFDELFPIHDGWAEGQRARGPDGSVFTVTRVLDHRPSGRCFPQPAFIDLDGDGGQQFSAADCTRIG